MESYAVRITHPQTTVRHILASWSTQCEKLVAFEHTDATKVHSHILILNTRVGKKQLRNIAANCGVNVKGNEYMSFRAYDHNERYLVYMSKGQFTPYYLQGYTQEECEAAKSQWVPDQKKESPQVRIYNRFEASLDLQSQEFKKYVEAALALGNAREVMTGDLRFQWIKTKGSAFAFAECDRLANPKYVNMYKMLVNTYCMRHNVPMDQKWKGTIQ